MNQNLPQQLTELLTLTDFIISENDSDTNHALPPLTNQNGSAGFDVITLSILERSELENFLKTLPQTTKLLAENFFKQSKDLFPLANNHQSKVTNWIYCYELTNQQLLSDNEIGDHSPTCFTPLPPLLKKLWQEPTYANSKWQIVSFTKKSQKFWIQLYIGLGLGCYDYKSFIKKNPENQKNSNHQPNTSLLLPALPKTEINFVKTLVNAHNLARFIIDSPPNLMGPVELEQIFQWIANQYQAKFKSIIGEELLGQNFPMIHAVGKGSSRNPRMLELQYGQSHHTKVTLIGKGVCFDTGGLNLKTAGGMWLMKKDLGGAAIALALAYAIMALQLPYQLQLLLGIAENMPSGSSYRPSDILTARNGKKVEVGDTDAEGRLILADLLSYAMESPPKWLVDFSTLTGAARIAVGTEISALFCNDEMWSKELIKLGFEWFDPLWQLPLYMNYRDMLESNFADISSTGSSDYAGAITAALFLTEFIKPNLPNKKTLWAHIDTMAWNLSKKSGIGVGGRAMTLTTLLRYFYQQV